ncbi:DUF4145 domain-containing protein [Nocardia sp. CA-107356]|uniref:DUF4145 domain-containing protein n=1 Tax=Nocardia sp. CA-107356 TaxID=3239972 RepID=UPI003D93FD7F
MANDLSGDLLVTADRLESLEKSDVRSWQQADCAHCHGSQAMVIATTSGHDLLKADVEWLRCVRCHRGLVRNEGVLSPGVCPLETPHALPPEDVAAWEEVRSCLSVGANTAAVMMCRKLLVHVAIAHELPAKDEKNRSPSFARALDHLEDVGIVTAAMRTWIDRIKDVGNEANHELTSISEKQAMDVAKFTYQLLHLAYELPAMIADSAPGPPAS